MKINALITGCNGFVGGYLFRELKKRKQSVFGIGIEKKGKYKFDNYRNVNVTNKDELLNVIYEWGIDVIYHLAAIADPRTAQKNPSEAIAVNLGGTSNVLESSRLKDGLKILFVSSSEVYDLPYSISENLKEEYPVFGKNIYGNTKLCGEILCKGYFKNYGSKVYISRSFNHTGRGQDERYVLSSFAKQLVEIKYKKRISTIRVGNIYVYRDFLDVRDVVKAYIDIVEKGKPGEVYNVCSGNAFLLKNLLQEMIEILKLEEVVVKIDPDRVRKDDIQRIVGSREKIFNEVGWEPKIKIRETLKEILQYWEESMTLRNNEN